jgi:GTPase
MDKIRRKSLEKLNNLPNKLEQEKEDGNIEYKREIISMGLIKEKYAIQMIYRLNEGNGVAYYYLGVYDNGKFYDWTKEIKKKSLQNLIEIVDYVDSKIEYIIEFNSGYKVKIKSDIHKNNFLSF